MKQATLMQSSQSAALTMRAPMPSVQLILAPIAAPAASSIAVPAASSFAFGICANGFEAGVAAETANATTRLSGLAYANCAAKKHDRKYNWQLRPLSLRGGSG